MSDSHNDLPIWRLGPHPISNRFIENLANEDSPAYNMELTVCPYSGLLRLATPIPVEELRPRFEWITCFEPEDHLDDLVGRITNLPGVNLHSKYAGYSFKDDSTLRRIEKLGHINTWRIDPVCDLKIDNKCANVETYQSVFNVSLANQIRETYGPADVLIVRHVVEHAYNLTSFVQSIARLLRPGGYIVWEVPDCEAALLNGDCTMFWEEHISYFTEFTFKAMLLSEGFSIVHFATVPYPRENTLVAIVKLESIRRSPSALTEILVNDELERVRHFIKSTENRKMAIRKILERYALNGKRIALYGAGHLAVSFMSINEITGLVDVVLDDDQNKAGLFMPLSAIPIESSDMLDSNVIDVCLLALNPQNHYKVISRHQGFVQRGGIFASIFPGTNFYVEELL